MIDPMQAILQPTIPPTNIFPASSRYNGSETAIIQSKENKVIIYLQRRFIPPQQKFETLQEHVVTQGERLDHIAAHYYGDPQLFWRICDANSAMRPDELIEIIGRRLRITLPEGIAGPIL